MCTDYPAFQGGDEITEIPSSELEKPITERIKYQERQTDKRGCDPGDSWSDRTTGD